MGRTEAVFGRAVSLIGMVHVGALPGTPRGGRPVGEIAAAAVAEARLLSRAGFDALLLENMHDVPYLARDVGPEIPAAMAAIGAEFVRAEGFVFASVADEGLLAEADAGPLLRYRNSIGAGRVRILADVKKKHSAHAITADVSLADTAKAAAFFGADGVIVTGAATGEATGTGDVAAVRAATELPVLVGSGVTPESAASLLENADALIVGSWYKRDGLWSNPPDPDRAAELVRAVRAARPAWEVQ